MLPILMDLLQNGPSLVVQTLVVRRMRIYARTIDMGYNDVPKNLPRLCVHYENGKVVARMLVCLIRSIDFIVCQDCGNTCA